MEWALGMTVFFLHAEPQLLAGSFLISQICFEKKKAGHR